MNINTLNLDVGPDNILLPAKSFDWLRNKRKQQ